MLKPELKILRSDFRSHRLRNALSVLGIGAAIGLLIWMMGSFDARQDDIGRSITQTMGKSDFLLMENTAARDRIEASSGYGTDPSKYGGGSSYRAGGIDYNLILTIQNHFLTANAFPVFVQRMKAKIGTNEGRPSFVSAAGVYPYHSPFAREQIRGEWLDTDSTTNDVVIGTASFVRGVPILGDTLVLESDSLTVKCRVAGIIRQKYILEEAPGLFISKELFHRLSPLRRVDEKRSYGTTLFISLTDKSERGYFARAFQELLQKHRPRLKLFSRDEAADKLRQKEVRAFAKHVPLPFILAFFTSVFIIFTTMSMGMTERVRQLALLRMVGMNRGSVLLIFFSQGFALALPGWVCGLLLGYGFLAITVRLNPELYTQGVTITSAAVIISLLCALVSAFSAALFPAWRSTVVRPIDAILPVSPAARSGFPLKTLLTGVLCITAAPVIVYLLPVSELLQKKLFSYAGMPLLVLGFVLLTPVVVIISEWLFGPVIGFCLRVERRLFQRLLTANMWRTIGTVISLSLGLSCYITIQIWGDSLLNSFLPSRNFPDLTALFLPNGLGSDELQRVSTIPEIDALLPLAVRQYPLSEKTVSAAQAHKGGRLKQTNILTVGLDPVKAFAGPAPVCPFRFVRGSPDKAVSAMRSGRGCVIVQNIRNECGWNIGDEIWIMASGREVRLKVAAVVELNWHMLTSTAQMRALDGQPFGTLGPVFIDYEFSRLELGHKHPRFLWMNVSPDREYHG